jgi:hypothetical protein
MLYSKNGSIPKEQTDGTEGWIEVPDMPEAPEGKEVVWWYPPGWVIRDPKPEEREGYKWSWSQSNEQWVEYALLKTVIEVEPVTSAEASALTSGDIQALTSLDISALSSGDIVSLTTDQISGLE